MITVYQITAMPSHGFEASEILARFRNWAQERLAGASPSDFRPVAVVDTDDLDEAYRLTNHIDKLWWHNEKVVALRESRSTSIGDVLDVNGKYYVVDRCGFTA